MLLQSPLFARMACVFVVLVSLHSQAQESETDRIRIGFQVGYQDLDMDILNDYIFNWMKQSLGSSLNTIDHSMNYSTTVSFRPFKDDGWLLLTRFDYSDAELSTGVIPVVYNGSWQDFDQEIRTNAWGISGSSAYRINTGKKLSMMAGVGLGLDQTQVIYTDQYAEANYRNENRWKGNAFSAQAFLEVSYWITKRLSADLNLRYRNSVTGRMYDESRTLINVPTSESPRPRTERLEADYSGVIVGTGIAYSLF